MQHVVMTIAKFTVLSECLNGFSFDDRKGKCAVDERVDNLLISSPKTKLICYAWYFVRMRPSISYP